MECRRTRRGGIGGDEAQTFLGFGVRSGATVAAPADPYPCPWNLSPFPGNLSPCFLGPFPCPGGLGELPPIESVGCAMPNPCRAALMRHPPADSADERRTGTDLIGEGLLGECPPGGHRGGEGLDEDPKGASPLVAEEHDVCPLDDCAKSHLPVNNAPSGD